MLKVLDALSNRHRLRAVARLASAGPAYISQLARDIGISRPLMHLHLRKLEAAGLVTWTVETAEDGKAISLYQVEPFAVTITPTLIAESAHTLSAEQAAGSTDS